MLFGPEPIQIPILLAPSQIRSEIVSRYIRSMHNRQSASTRIRRSVSFASVAIFIQSAPDKQILTKCGFFFDQYDGTFVGRRQRIRRREWCRWVLLTEVDGDDGFRRNCDRGFAFVIHVDLGTSAPKNILKNFFCCNFDKKGLIKQVKFFDSRKIMGHTYACIF